MRGLWGAIAGLFGLLGASLGSCSPPGGPPPNPPAPTAVCRPLSSAATVGTAARPTPAAPADATIGVDLDSPAGPANEHLGGLVWNTGANLDAVADLEPTTVRVDGSLGSRSPARGQLDVQPLLDRLTEIRSVGAEPVVILSYMPRWLGQPTVDARLPGANPTRVGPYDLDAWEQLVYDVVRATATAPEPALAFEVWNEPDHPVFWQDSRQAFVDMAVRTHRAVAAVERDTGLDLEIGGPGLALAVSTTGPLAVAYLDAIRSEGLGLDFWSWHRYANFPYFGPDGNEGHVDEALYAVLGKLNPNATPLGYSTEIREVRAQLDTALAGTGLDPYLYLDEWNVSGGGLDLRHDTAVGAAFNTAILVEMERAGLDRAAFYRSASSEGPGDWGLVSRDGVRKPMWWLFRAWAAMDGERLAVTDDPASGLYARATRSEGGCVQVLLSNFLAAGSPDRVVDLDVAGRLPRGRCEATVSSLDAASTTFEAADPVVVPRGHPLRLAVPGQSVQLLRIDC